MGLSFTRIVGCASIDYTPAGTEPIITGHAMVSTDTSNPRGTTLHELLHAVGVIAHSPYPTDIMYAQETRERVTTMTQRDINTLRRLYASPSYAD